MADVRSVLFRGLSADNTVRKEAEALLAQWEVSAGFSVSLLQLISTLSTAAASGEDVAIRQSASVLFKNVVRRRWSPGEDEDKSVRKIGGL